jgi:hypothetical protein
MKKLMFIFVILVLATIAFAQSDPAWIWANGGGTVGVDNGRGITTDNSGNTYITGFFNGTANFGDLTLVSTEGSTDVFVVKIDPNGNYLWARSSSGAGSEEAYGITNDGNGNCYITGQFGGTALFGLSSITSENAGAVFVAMIDNTGLWLWATKAAGNDYGEERAYGIAADNSGNAYVTGYIKGDVSFGLIQLATSSADNKALFVAKIDAGGNWIWAVKGGGTSWDNQSQGNGVGYGGGYCYVTGYFTGTAPFAELSLTSVGGADIVVGCLDATGGWQWVKGAGSNFSEYGNAVAADNDGNCFVTGYFNLTTTFGDIALTAGGAQSDVFVAKFGPTGLCLWANRAGGPGGDEGRGIAVDNNGNSYITGNYISSSDFGSFTLPGHGTDLSDTFAAKLDTNGNWVWADGAGSINEDWGFRISCDNNGNCYLIGMYSYTQDFGSITITGNGGDVFTAKHDSGVVSNEDNTVPGLAGLSALYNVYPNPFHQGETIQIKTNISEHEIGTLSIFNLRGQTVASYSLNSGTHQTSLDTNGLAAGIYFYQLKTGISTVTKKMVVLK